MAPTLGRLALPIDVALAEAIEAFDCVGDKHAEDDVARNVCDFLCSHRYRAGIVHGVTATYLFLDPELEPSIVGYATLALDAVRLTNSEKKQFGDLVYGDFGAVRIQMIGVDSRHQKQGHGTALLEAVTEQSRRVSQAVPARFLLADANVRQVGWYEARGFVANRAERQKTAAPERTTSMRLDLKSQPESADTALAA